MLVNGTAADVASARKRYLGLLVFAKQSAQQIIGSSDLLDILIVHVQRVNGGAVDLHSVAILAVYPRTNAFDGLKQDVGISYIRYIFNQYGLICHNCCCQNGKCGILGTADLYFADQGVAAFNYVLFHITPRTLLLHILS